MLPAYIPNPLAAVFGGGKPIDGGRLFTDGKRILGDGKTYRGLVAGIGCGVLVGSLQIWLSRGGAVFLGVELPAFGLDWPSALKVVFMLASGSLFGDMFKSFFKRRMGFKRGAPLPLVDQLDFVIGSWVFTYLAAPEWFVSNFTAGIMLTVVLMTPLLHLSTNIIGYLIGVKKEPW